VKAPLVRWELQSDRSQRSDEQVRLLTSRMLVFGIYVLPSAITSCVPSASMSLSYISVDSIVRWTLCVVGTFTRWRLCSPLEQLLVFPSQRLSLGFATR
jgi:hypothetical protein